MVEELRKIILSYEEVLLALDAHRRVTPAFLPPGKIMGWKAGVEVLMVVQIESQDRQMPAPKEITLKSTDLFEPAVKFCIANNILLPRNSRKCVRIERDRVALYIIIGSLDESMVCTPD